MASRWLAAYLQATTTARQKSQLSSDRTIKQLVKYATPRARQYTEQEQLYGAARVRAHGRLRWAGESTAETTDVVV